MATESVKILIEAEDKATAQLQKAVREQEKAAAKSALIKQQQEQAITAERIALEQGVEAAEAYRLTLQGLDSQTAALIAKEKMLVQQQKQTNAEIAKQPSGLKSTKATTEFFGAVAGMAGGSQIASVASQLGALTEKTNQFSEVAKAGGASAMLFKAGIVAAAGAIGFEVGQALGNAIFRTEKWKTELDKLTASSDRFVASLARIRSQSFADELSKIELLPEADRESAIKSTLATVKTEIKGVAAQTEDANKRFKELQKWQGYDWTFELKTGQDLQVELENAKREIERVATEKERLNEQAKQLERKLTIEVELDVLRKDQASSQFLATLEDQLQSLKAELNGTKNEYEAFKNTFSAEDGGTAKALLEDIQLTKDKLTEKQNEEEQLKRIDDLRKAETDRLKEQAIALEQGKEAAHRFRLEKQGLSAEDAKTIAAEQARIDRLEAEKKASEKPTKAEKQQSLQAVESRLLTRGPEQDPVAKNTAEMTKLAKMQLDKLIAIHRDSKPSKTSAKPTQLELVSR